MSKIKVFDSIKDFIEYRNTELKNKTIGFVPTMGALHAGHASLIEKSALENEITVLSIYINPTQFNNSNDLSTYPKTLTADIKLAEQSGAQVIITPKYSEIYPDLYTYKIIESEFSKILCGATRVGHFDGVLTIVMKLLQIVSAQKAYFGQKDYQQYLLIKNMKEAFFLQTEIIALPTKREASGLAMSSRNTRLSEYAKALAAFIYQGLQIENITDAALFLKNKNIEIEYLEEHFNRRFVAAHIDGVRLIDNVAI